MFDIHYRLIIEDGYQTWQSFISRTSLLDFAVVKLGWIDLHFLFRCRYGMPSFETYGVLVQKH